MTRMSEKERLEAAAERYEVLKHVLRDPLHTRNLGREDTLRELIDWVNDKIEAKANEPIEFCDYEYINGLNDAYQLVLDHCESLLDKETNHGDEHK